MNRNTVIGLALAIAATFCLSTQLGWWVLPLGLTLGWLVAEAT